MIYPSPRLLVAGDAALLVEFGDEISDAVNARVRALDAALCRAAVPGIVETIPGYASLLVEYDPCMLGHRDMAGLVEEYARAPATVATTDRAIKEVPTVYGGECGPDLADVAAAHGLTEQEVVTLHGASVYTVYMLGFSPGFAYMGSVPDEIATPRLATPRTRVPAGSVAIAGRQTGVYPASTPGGWRLLGRTNIVPFDPRRDPACFFQPGDRVRFRAVDALGPAATTAENAIAYDAYSTVDVLSPGLLTTVQDLGRSGYQRFGVPVSGAMDPFSLRVGNALVGNPADAAGLEVTVAGPTLQFAGSGLVAITGGDLGPVLHTPELASWPAPLWTSIYVRAGSILEFVGRKSGCRCYVTFAGGVVTSPIMNSRSTYLTGRLGGFDGRPLQAGDEIPIGEPSGHLPSIAGRSVKPELLPAYGAQPTVRVVMGPHDDYFSRDALQVFADSEYEVSTTSDRMGLRLQGPSLEHVRAKEIVSAGVPAGAIQVPPNGQPIVLTADRQTAGGYPVLATVIHGDLPLLAQCVPGSSRVRFQVITVEQAQAIDRAGAHLRLLTQEEPDAISF